MDVEGLFGRVAAVANSERWLIPIFKKKTYPRVRRLFDL
jgi:hypothetical protein